MISELTSNKCEVINLMMQSTIELGISQSITVSALLTTMSITLLAKKREYPIKFRHLVLIFDSLSASNAIVTNANG